MLVTRHLTKTNRIFLKVTDHRLGEPLESGTHVTGFFAQPNASIADILIQEMMEDRSLNDALYWEINEAMVEFLDKWLEHE